MKLMTAVLFLLILVASAYPPEEGAHTMLELQNITKVYNPGTVQETVPFPRLFADRSGRQLRIGRGQQRFSGKTSMLNIVCGSIPVEGGKHIHGRQGHNQNARVPAATERMGRVYQNPAMGTCPSMTILENLAMADNKGKSLRPWARHKQAPHGRLPRACWSELGLGLEDKLGVTVGSLSGGQRQALALLMSHNDTRSTSSYWTSTRRRWTPRRPKS